MEEMSARESPDLDIVLSKTSLSCPQMFHKPVQPSYRPTPTPDPKVYEGYTFKAEFNHGEVKWGVDLTKIVGTYTFDVALGYHTYYEFATILYSPVNGLVLAIPTSSPVSRSS